VSSSSAWRLRRWRRWPAGCWARRAAARLVRLTDAAESVTATGRLEVHVPSAGSDEFARLGGAFDAMLLRLGQAREDQQRLVQDAGH
jgi:two-component system sensor histidine kinase MprB